MSYIDRLNVITAQKQAEGSLTQPTLLPPKAELSVLSGGTGGTFVNPREALATWRAHLGRLHWAAPLNGVSACRWCELIIDAGWLLDTFGESAARDGWTTADLFGLSPDSPGWGGLTDRLQGSRSLTIDADRAEWRSSGGVTQRFNRGSYPDLRPFWEM